MEQIYPGRGRVRSLGHFFIQRKATDEAIHANANVVSEYVRLKKEYLVSLTKISKDVKDLSFDRVLITAGKICLTETQ